MQNASEETVPAVISRELAEHYLSVSPEELPLTEAEKERFIATAVTYQLNPFKRELHARVLFEDGQRRMKLITGYEVYIKKAERTGLLDGWKACVEGSGETLRAVVEIQRKDWSRPFIHEVYWNEAVQHDSSGKVNGFWERMPKFQLKKVAISQGFRLCFSNEIGGIPYDSAELPIREMPLAEPGQKPAAGKARETDTGFSAGPLVGAIHSLAMENRDILSPQHLEWIENQLRMEKTEPQLRGLLKHVRECIASGGDAEKEKGRKQRTQTKQPRVPSSYSKPAVPQEIPIY
ncbi:recombinase RecT [Brucepastera parasyntrophica]|uniref:RecT family recombinase n=1 Tax=Brucepastera parasyntrophica TaxID=2880008 RepID=UPI00210CDFF8|nr:RecT family recombinase [Brucepastera parasyntrophica]ULQ60402.1 recombinase RecT [Brucepastera parasyntrophica]